MGFHIVKRDNCPVWKRCLFYAVAIVAALVTGGIVLMAMDVNPFDYYYQMFTMGIIENYYPENIYMNYLKMFVPLALTATALSLAFKMRFWNIGGEGQFIMGAIAAATVAFKLGPNAPQTVTIIAMCLAAMLAAGVYGLVAGLLKVKFGTNETLMTLMMNYIALYALAFIADTKSDWNFYLDPTSNRPKFQSFSSLVSFPTIKIGERFELNICVILVLVVGALVYVYLKYTKHGYEIGVIGDSEGTAKYAGMKTKKIVLRTVFLSAALIGLAAAFKVGTSGILSKDDLTGSVGWTGIIVAWLAQLNTVMIFVVSALICVLQFGSAQANAEFGQVDSSFANMLQGAILFLVLAAEFFVRFRIARTRKAENNNG